jgi:YbbR domain-containing protein
MEWFYENKLLCALIAFLAALIVFIVGHKMSINYVYTNPTSDYDLMRKYDRI